MLGVTVDTNPAVNFELQTDTIAAKTTVPVPLISFVDGCAVGTVDSNKPFTVNGTLTAKAATVQNNLTVSGSLSVSGFYARKPWCSILVATSTAGKTSGAFAVASFGQQTITTANITRAGADNVAYVITFPTAHPNGANFAVIATPQTSASDTWDSSYYSSAPRK